MTPTNIASDRSEGAYGTERHLEHHTIRTADGWSLQLTRVVRRGERAGQPVLFIPGYGMNAWIVQYHPRGRSFADVLLEGGFDPWGIDLRGTSTSKGPTRPSFQAMSTHDLPAAIDYIRNFRSAERVHAIGCSLGGAMLLGHAAFAPSPGLDRVVTIGTPLRWPRDLRTRLLSTLMRTAGSIPMRGTRAWTAVALPVVSRLVPSALSIYLNPRITDVRMASELTRTVEDPLPVINRALGHWMRSDLRIQGRPVAPALKRFDRPLLVMYGSGDGIVPREAALSVVGTTRGPVEVLEVEHPDGEPVGHADLFISDVAPTRVFEPVTRFLRGPADAP
ncbi:MAG: alpha/beta fold hydrolase, partial [Myxococcota bacterium]